MEISPFMAQALRLAEKGRLNAPPNPWVGCLIVKDGQIIGAGYHEKAGAPHAEKVALMQAGTAAQGATLYCTLEPCNHHGRTPPCTEAILKAGVQKVVAAVEDPDPKVAGEGLAHLQRGGLQVEVGDGASQVRESLKPYIHHRKTGMPWCLLKTAISVDGRIAASDGTSQWITGEGARRDAHRLRAESQAVAVGSGTAKADHPSLTVRLWEPKPLKPPLRVVFDTRGRLSPEGPLFDGTKGPTLIFTGPEPSQEVQRVKDLGVEVCCLGLDEDGKRLDLKAALRALGGRGVLQLMVEGGAGLQGSFFKEGLVNEFVAYVGGKLLGKNGIPCLDLELETLAEAPSLTLKEVARFDGDARLRYQTDTCPP